ncbi:MAG: UDP-N-acetylmuramoyl-L-alanine--D-glutamate ligase [Patescibacteria group bacterium]|jgi:UDP-N-acetylmuramoylalanine--D-glutamate ligase
MTLKDLENKKICILGLGMENCSLLKFLLKQKIEAEITVCDARSKKQMCDYDCNIENNECARVKWKTGKDYDNNLNEFDIIFRVAGYPLFTKQIIKAMMSGVIISSPAKLFFDLCPTRNIIGVTGTKGKGTTASMIYQIIKDAGKTAYFGGNIGIPMFKHFSKIKKNDWVILELSSFQLEDLHASPRIAVITNFFQDHLAPADPNNPNFHKTLKTYWDAKSNIFIHQDGGGMLIADANLKDPVASSRPKGKVKYFNTSSLETKLIGNHNKKNIAAAVIVAEAARIKKADIEGSIKNFKGLEYRLEFVGMKNNIRYYNDSFSTTPDTAITAIGSFNKNGIILIAGGSDKGSDFLRLAKTIKQDVKYLILLPGKGSQKIKLAIKKTDYKNFKEVNNMPQAVNLAKKIAEQGDVVLLSPACASFGIFKNYKDRGNQFKEEVLK